jgi:ABC-type transport system involved in cytochrome c biogenesis permease subunit
VNKTTISKILAPIASLRLTVVLLALSMIVILAGTTAQEHLGIWQVQDKYFHSFFCNIDLDLLFPLVRTHIPGSIPMLGGYSLIFLLLANLLSAHGLRFKVSPWDIVLLPMLGFLLAILWAWQNNHAAWLMALGCVISAAFMAGVFAVHKKRGGVILIHLGLILLLVGELVTSLMAVESRMTIDEGGSASYSYDVRDPELVLADASSPHQDKIYAIDGRRLRQGVTISDPRLPAGVQVKIDRFYPNSYFARASSANAASAPAITTPLLISDKPVAALPQAQFTGAGDEASKVDMPSAYVTLSKSGQTIGTFLATVLATAPTRIEIDGKPFDLSLRFRRYYLPFRLDLKDFRFDRYVGTDTPKNYSAQVRLVDPIRNEDREVIIKMNDPLRHAGLTFYQASFEKSETTTHLQVVRNPGVLIPYVSCIIGGVGMLAHFGIALLTFLRKRSSVFAGTTLFDYLNPVRRARLMWKVLAADEDSNGPANGKRPRGDNYTLQPQRNWAAIILSTLVGGVAAIYLLSVVMRPAPASKPFDLTEFGKVPISFGGRQQPLDSIARNHLKVISGREEFKDEQSKTQPAIKWLLDMFTRQAGDHQVFRIDHSGIKNILAQHLPPPAPGEQMVLDRKLFTAFEIGKAFDELNRQIDRANSVEPKNRDLFQRKIVDLSRQMHMAGQLGEYARLFFVPPTSAGAEWRMLGQAVRESGGDMASIDPSVRSLVTMIDAYSRNDSQTFNQEVARYRGMLDEHIPTVLAKTDFETRFNRIAPFIVCMALYIGVFLLAVGSWLGWREPLRRSAYVLLLVTLAFHTLALIGRIYISGRPPVTNLYSSAIFIAWGTAIFAALLERVYRNGIGSVTAAVTAFPSLLIAHYLSFSGSGDTMEVLQAVLDTNIWLATHVVAITLGYAATFLAGFLGIAYILLGVATPMLSDETRRKAIARMIYGILCFAMILSFVGTVLGGIWADQSWGRFWGWDPKENGAVLIVLWNAVILHARWGGIVRERGLACLAVFGNIVTAWSWFGTNMLGLGLHSYGFMDSALFWLGAFVFSQLGIILIGNLPQGMWWSMRTQGAQGRGFEPRVVRKITEKTVV